MKKLPFYLIYIISLSLFAVPTYLFLQNYEDSKFIQSIGIGNFGITAVIVCIFPALLISIWWWNAQEQYEDEDSD